MLSELDKSTERGVIFWFKLSYLNLRSVGSQIVLNIHVHDTGGIVLNHRHPSNSRPYFAE